MFSTKRAFALLENNWIVLYFSEKNYSQSIKVSSAINIITKLNEILDSNWSLTEI